MNIRILLPLLIVLIISININAQDQYTFFSEGNVWEHRCNSNEGSWGYELSYKILGDTIYNGLNCKIIENQYTDKIILAEDSKKVYVKRFNFDNDLNVMYDFNLQVNDTFEYSYYVYQEDKFQNGKMKVVMVDSVEMLNGEFRKRINLEHFGIIPGSMCPFDASWIDGIGDINNHSMYLLAECFESNCWLGCFTMDSTYIYGQCGPNSTEEIIDVKLKLYPNPTCERISFVSEHNLVSAQIFSKNGIKVSNALIEDQTIILPTYLSADLYYIKMWLSNDKAILRKIIKQNCH